MIGNSDLVTVIKTQKGVNCHCKSLEQPRESVLLDTCFNCSYYFEPSQVLVVLSQCYLRIGFLPLGGSRGL